MNEYVHVATYEWVLELEYQIIPEWKKFFALNYQNKQYDDVRI